MADPGRAEPFALQQRLEDLALRQAADLGGFRREFLKRLLFGIGLDGRNHRVG